MPIHWDVYLDAWCDVAGCKEHLSVVGDNPRACVARVKQAGWLYRKNTDDGHIMVRCPEHHEITHDMEDEDVYNNP